MKVRFIGASDNNMGREEIIFTEDFYAPAEEFFYGDLDIYRDKIIDMDECPSFPLETLFVKKG